jgi:Tol biopolymer transport system component
MLLRPSPEVFPEGAAPASASRMRADGADGTARAAQGIDITPSSPAEPDGAAGPPSISDDGSRVAFSSDASNLIRGDSNGERTDPFVRDFPGATTLAADSVRDGLAHYGGRFRRGPSGALSADGRFAVFSSRSSDLGRTGSGYRIWVRDLADGTTRLACKAGNAAAESPVISADGRRVAFESLATDLAGSDVNQQTDVYWCDLESREVRRVSTPIADGVNTSGTSLSPSLSGDGRFVAFTSDSGGLVAGDGGRAGVFWKDMETGQVVVVDAPAGAPASNGIGTHPRISNDGQYVVFDSDATDLPGGAQNGRAVDVFRKHVVTGTVDLISAASGGANADSTANSISGDGNVVAFSSAAGNLVQGDTNGTTDAFTRNLVTGAVTRVSTRPDGGELSGPSYAAAVSGTGRYVAFASRAPDAEPGGSASERSRIYRKDVFTGELLPASIGVNLTPRTRIDAPLGTLPRRKARTIEGTANDDDGVERVEVSMSRSIGRGRCLWLRRGGRVSRGRCARPMWVGARLDNGLRFSLRIRRLLPRGTWRLRTRATDGTGKREPVRGGTNTVRVRLR